MTSSTTAPDFTSVTISTAPNSARATHPMRSRRISARRRVRRTRPGSGSCSPRCSAAESVSCRLSSCPRKSYVDMIAIGAKAQFRMGSPRACGPCQGSARVRQAHRRHRRAFREPAIARGAQRSGPGSLQHRTGVDMLPMRWRPSLDNGGWDDYNLFEPDERSRKGPAAGPAAVFWERLETSNSVSPEMREAAGKMLSRIRP